MLAMRTMMMLVLSSAVMTLAGDAAAEWSGPDEIITGVVGTGRGEIGNSAAVPVEWGARIESVSPDGTVVIADRISGKSLSFGRDGKFIQEKAVGPTTSAAQEGAAGVVRARSLQTVRRDGGVLSIAVIFPDATAVLTSDHEFDLVVRDSRGAFYGIDAERIVRYTEAGRRSGELVLPRPHEELLSDADRQRTKRIGAYVDYSGPVITASGDVLMLKTSDVRFTVLRWTWSEAPAGPENVKGATDGSAQKLPGK